MISLLCRTSHGKYVSKIYQELCMLYVKQCINTIKTKKQESQHLAYWSRMCILFNTVSADALLPCRLYADRQHTVLTTRDDNNSVF